MSQLPNSPIEQDKPVSLPLEAVEAMLENDVIAALFDRSADPEAQRNYLDRLVDGWHNAGKSVPDWIWAAVNCAPDYIILPVAIHTFLMDWKPEAKS